MNVTANKQWTTLTVEGGGQSVDLPLCEIQGAADGPRMVVIANQHGQEVNGVEAVRRFCEEIDPAALRGSVIAIPTMNPRAALNRLQTWDEGKGYPAFDPRSPHMYDTPWNLNRLWPGKTGGTWAEAAVHAVWTRFVKDADLLVDVHCHMHRSCVYGSSPLNAEFALATGIDVINVGEAHDPYPMSQDVCERAGIAAFTFELGGQRMFVEQSIEDGRRALYNLLRFIGITEGNLELPDKTLMIRPWPPGEDHATLNPVMYSQLDGYIVTFADNYAWAETGQLLCHVVDPHTGRVAQEVRAPSAGYVNQLQWYDPICRKGDKIAMIAACAVEVDTPKIVARMRADDYLPWPQAKRDTYLHLTGP